MAIEKNSVMVSRFDSEFCPDSKENMSSEEVELQLPVSVVNSEEEEEEEDDLDEVDSGAGSDDFDLLELGESKTEFCQVGNVTCSVPFELYDLPGLEDVLSVDVWNDCLTEDDRFGLSKYLPDMDQGTFGRTLKELFEGSNFQFGSPIRKLFDMLKGGLCEPRVALYREGTNFFQRKKHYHMLRKYQNNMVSSFCQMRDALMNYKGYNVNEKLSVLNIMKSQKSLTYGKLNDFETDASEKEESVDGMWSRRVKHTKATSKLGRDSLQLVDTTSKFPLRGQQMAMGPGKYGKQNLKHGQRPGRSRLPSLYNGLDSSSGALPMEQYDPLESARIRDHVRIDDDVGHPLFGRRDRNFVHGSMRDKSSVSGFRKKHAVLRDEEQASDSFMGIPIPLRNSSVIYGGDRIASYQSELKAYSARSPNMTISHDFIKKGKYPDSTQLLAARNKMKSQKGNLSVLPGHDEPYWDGRTQHNSLSVNPSFESGDWNRRNKHWAMERESLHMGYNSYRASPLMRKERFLKTQYTAKPLTKLAKVSTMQNGEHNMIAIRGGKSFLRSEDTESDSSEEDDDDAGDEEDEDDNPWLRSKLASSSHGSLLKSRKAAGKAPRGKKGMQENQWALDGPYSEKIATVSERAYMPGTENYYSKTKQKSNLRESGPFSSSATRSLPDSQLQGQSGEQLYRSALKAYPTEGEQKDFDDNDDKTDIRLLADDSGRGRLPKKRQSIESQVKSRGEKSEIALLGCNNSATKRKAKEDLRDMEGRGEDGNLQQMDGSASMKKKRKKKSAADTGSPLVETSQQPITEAVVDMEIEIKPQKKSFTLITPTVHTGFSFSIMHLLSAVRMAMVSTSPEDALEAGNLSGEQDQEHQVVANGLPPPQTVDEKKPDLSGQWKLPSLTIQEIVNRVKSNPGDPCILETQEPLQDLVRGVLKIFSSRTAPLGAKSWKALVAFDKPTKSWSWICPVSHGSADYETIEEVTSPEAWGLPHKVLVKLVDSFATWLKNGQETLQLIGSLPPPPLSLMLCNLDEKERFKDLRAQKSLNTITASSEEVRDYFRKEEVLRYSIPDRAFNYMAVDGKKSIVAPLRRCGGKPTSKARDHFMLKRDRPPHVTILCLVRDAAARLPGSIGTRADVCTLIRDSQYIVEDVSDTQINQVVSGALDRLHYERDPCVQFDGERKLWVYLHRDREEEDFEDDGTSSTKKWKRQKKDAPEQSDHEAVTIAYHEAGEQSGFQLGSDPPAEPSGNGEDRSPEVPFNDVRENAEGNDQQNTHEVQPVVLDDIDTNIGKESKLLCLENSIIEDFEDEISGEKDRSDFDLQAF